MKLTTVNEYVWLFSLEVGFVDDGSSLLVVGFAFVRFAYFAFLIWVLSGLVCNLHIDDQTLTKMNFRKTKHFYLPTLALGSADWEHTKRPPPPSHPVGSLHPRQPPIIKTSLSNSIWTLCLKIFAHFIETLSIFALFFQTFVPKYRDVISFVIDSFEITAQ